MEAQTLISLLQRIFSRERISIGDNATLYVNEDELFEEIERFDPIESRL